MNIKTRLSLQFTTPIFIILLIFSILVYFFSNSRQRSKFRENLLIRAQNTAILLINVEEVDSTLLKKIHKTTLSFEDEEIKIIDLNNKTWYSNNCNYLEKIEFSNYLNKTFPDYFTINEKDGVVYRHHTRTDDYFVFILAYDKYRNEYLRELQNILFWTIIIGIWLSVTASYFFSKIAIKPISKIISGIKDINSFKLSSRLDEGNRKDEIEQLAITFNQLLSKLEIAFKSQDEFVSNASHELKTPLAVMIAEADYILKTERKTDIYVDCLENMVYKLRQMNYLLNSLLELAQINSDRKISITAVRLDEILINAIKSIKEKYPKRKITPEIKYPENESELYLNGNSGLLEIALKNLIDNACKFSDEEVIVSAYFDNNNITVVVSDYGIGIPAKEKNEILNPFKRASNSTFIAGFGVGLSIVKQITELHSGEIKIYDNSGKGTCFELVLPKINK